MLKFEDRCKSLPKILTLEAEIPVLIPVLDDAGKDTGKTKDGEETKTTTFDLKLVLPGMGWSPVAIEVGEILAQQIKNAALEMVAEGNAATVEEASMLLIRKFMPNIFTLYYIGKDEKLFLPLKQIEKIKAFQYSVYPFSDEQEGELLDDFFQYCRRFTGSSRMFSILNLQPSAGQQKGEGE